MVGWCSNETMVDIGQSEMQWWAKKIRRTPIVAPVLG